MNKKMLMWLHQELPKWRKKNWITEDIADEMLAFYHRPLEEKGPSLLRLLVVILGLSMVGLGIVLLFADYWYSFSPNGRLDSAVGLLVTAFIFVALAMWRVPRGSAWAEGASSFYFIALGGAVALVGDTFYLGDNSGLFLLYTLLLSLPITYLLNSATTLFAYLLGCMFWSVTGNALNFIGGAEVSWVFFLLAVPLYIENVTSYKEKQFNRVLFLSWGYIIALFGAFFFTLQTHSQIIPLLFLSALSTMAYLTGLLAGKKNILVLPLRWLGAAGNFYVIFMANLTETWLDIRALPSLSYFGLFVAFIFIGTSSFLLYEMVKRRHLEGILLGLSPLIIALCAFLARQTVAISTITLIIMTYVFVFATILLVRGALFRNIGIVNSGLALFITLALTRFFDANFTFFERGTSFLVAGAILLLANLLYMRNKQKRVERLKKDLSRAKHKLAHSGKLATEDDLDHTLEGEAESESSVSCEDFGEGEREVENIVEKAETIPADNDFTKYLKEQELERKAQSIKEEETNHDR